MATIGESTYARVGRIAPDTVLGLGESDVLDPLLVCPASFGVKKTPPDVRAPTGYGTVLGPRVGEAACQSLRWTVVDSQRWVKPARTAPIMGATQNIQS